MTKAVSGRLSDKALAENTWGGAPSRNSVHYHDDGQIGTALRYMGGEALMDVDGEPLGNVMGKLATDVVLGRCTAQEAVDHLKVLCDRLPKSSQARGCLCQAISRMDGPAIPVPAVPDGTPEPLRQLVRALHAVPMVRREPEKELQPVVDIAKAMAAGRTSAGRVAMELRRLGGGRHESDGDAGKFEINRAVDAAIEALRKPGR